MTTNVEAAKLALVTGATGALGGALAKQIVARGFRVVLTGRDLPRLGGLAGELGPGARALAADLRSPADLARLVAQVPRVDLLVNAAGAAWARDFGHKAEEEVRAVIELNVTGLALLCRHYGQNMLEHGSGKILNIASVAALRPCPGLADYAASKAFVISLSRSLAAEWRPHNVVVTCCVPGPIRSRFAALAGLEPTSNEANAEGIAELCLRALDKRRTVEVVGRDVRRRYAAFALLPEPVQQAVARRSWRRRQRASD